MGFLVALFQFRCLPNIQFTGGKVRGFGLPLARIYARYFGGELTIKSMEGYGVDAYLYLPVLGRACENLPESVSKSPGNLDSNTWRANVGNVEESLNMDPYAKGMWCNRHEDFWTPDSMRN